MMNISTHRLHLRLLGTVLAASTLSGCFLNPDAMPPNDVRSVDRLYHSLIRLQPAVVEPQVETITMIHKVNFTYGEDFLSRAEDEELVRFLQESAADRKSRIEIDGPRKAAGRHDILTAARMAAIAEKLSAMGISAEIAAHPVQSMTKSDDAIVVTITRAMVIEPDCEVPKTIYSPRPTHVWSCSTATALGRMVVDPLDLASGRPLGPGDGDQQVLGVQRYRQDKVKALKNETTAGGS